MLCTRCLSIFRSHQRSDAHHYHRTHLVASVTAGCQVCRIIARDLPQKGYQKDIIDLRWTLKEENGGWALDFNLSQSTYSFGSFAGRFLLECWGPAQQESLDMAYKGVDSTMEASGQSEWNLPILPDNTGDSAVRSRAKWWLNECCSNHKECASGHDPTWFPKRLIDLTGYLPKVIDSESRDKAVAGYATLSHCWGPNPHFLTLNADNAEVLYTGIALEIIPQTFRDTMDVAKALDIKYLWIDSLCILQSGQGSREDWQEHCLTMRSIYSNAVLNIAATRARTADDGLFTHRDQREVQGINVRWHGFAERDCFWNLVDKGFYYHGISTMPLMQRGWVLQERLLARRMLHFSWQQVWWQCTEGGWACETFPFGSPHKNPPLGVPDFALRAPPMDDHGELKPTPRLMFGDWSAIIIDYTRCQLTYPDKDKLLALAGIVERLELLREDKFVAGFFRKELPGSLLWCVWKPSSRAGPSPRAPTWSWASMDGPVTTDFQPHERVASVEDIKFDETPDAQKHATQLLLHGYVVRVRLEISRYRTSLHIISTEHNMDIGDKKYRDVGSFLAYLDYQAYNMEDHSRTVAIPVKTGTEENGTTFVKGLLLYPVEEKPATIYKRIGTFTMSPKQAMDDMMRKEKRTVIIV